jgi:Tol biopolymer transport system component/DNA-binding winged helix-turn-helix (wHTH) protein
MSASTGSSDGSSRKNVIRFGVFEADLGSGELRRSGLRLKLQDRPFQILAALLARPGEVVTRDELRQQLWGDDTHVDFDRSLNIAVAKLRAALSDDAEIPRYIETLPRRGYRFIGQIATNGFGRGPEPVRAPQREDSSVPSDAATPVTAQTIPVKSPPWARRPTQLAAAVALLAVLGGTLWWTLQTRSKGEPTVLRSEQITNDGFTKRIGGAVDGSTIYFAEYRDGGTTLAQVSTSGGRVVPLRTPLKDPIAQDFSAARSELLAIDLAGYDGGTLWALKMPEGSARRVGGVVAIAAAWAPDGRTIAYARANRVYLCDPEGGNVQELTHITGSLEDLAWSPDGRVLRFSVQTSGDHMAIWEIGSDGRGLHPLFAGWETSGGQGYGRWTADGRYFIFQNLTGDHWNLWAVRENKNWSGREMAKPVLLSQGLMDQTAPIPSASGRDILIIGADARSEVVRYDARQSKFVPYLKGVSPEMLDFSQDGRWVAYTSYPDGKLWRSRMDGTDQSQLSPASLDATLSPRWSPDGKWIVFMGKDHNGSWRLYLVSSSGGPPRPLVDTQTDQGVATWSPDGKTIVFGDLYRPGMPASSLKIHLYDLASRRVNDIPGSEGLWTARWSPDGRHIAALTIHNDTVMLFDVTANKWRRLAKTNPIGDLVWSRTSDSLYFEDFYQQLGIFRIWLRSGKIERVASLTGFRPTTSRWMGVAPDDSPLILRETGSQEIYSLHCRLP